jgi:hypothetical protein
MNSAIRLLTLFALTQCWYLEAAELKAETKAAFKKYAAFVEARIERDGATASLFRVASTPETRGRLRNGEIISYSAKSLGIEAAIAIPAGQVQHWVGAAFLPHATIASATPRLQDYDNRKRFMGPEIIESRTLDRRGFDFEVYLRIVEKSIISGVFDLDLRITYQMFEKNLAILSRSERIVEVAGAQAPAGSAIRDRGLLWALNHYWRIAEGDGGLYVECEALVLSRRVPAFAQWFAEPLIAQASRRTLISTIRATLRMVSSQ